MCPRVAGAVSERDDRSYNSAVTREVRALARLEGWAASTAVVAHPSRLAEDGEHLQR
jgi:hypothetical protein